MNENIQTTSTTRAQKVIGALYLLPLLAALIWILLRGKKTKRRLTQRLLEIKV